MTWTAPDTAPARRAIGTTDLFVHPIGLDGSVFGWAAGPEDTAAVLDVYAGAGGNLVSTADHYAGGRSEVMIGSWLKSRRIRNEMIVATKVGKHPDNPGHSPRAVLAAVDESLARLGVEHIDLLSLDGEDEGVPVEDTLGALQQLREAGKIRAVGVAGFGEKLISHFEQAADGGFPPIDVILFEYNLLRRKEYERHLQQFAASRESCGLARLPLANGYLTGDFRKKSDFPASGIFLKAAQYDGKKARKVLAVLDEICRELGETPGRVSVAWVLTKPGIAGAIARCNSATQVGSFLEAAMLDLPPEHVARLDKVSS